MCLGVFECVVLEFELRIDVPDTVNQISVS